jgi:ribosomal protein S18 acetylase RimI-like enzyme
MSLEVRLASPDEYNAVGRVTLDAYVADGFLVADDDYAAELLDAATRGREAELVVALDDETADVIGTVTYCPPGSPWRELGSDGEGEFRMLAVAPANRGRGVGRALVQYCIDRTAQLGLSGLTICSLPEMTTAHRLYESFGFRRAPERDWHPVEDFTLWAFIQPRAPAVDRP